jgi:hypothetical protein
MQISTRGTFFLAQNSVEELWLGDSAGGGLFFHGDDEQTRVRVDVKGTATTTKTTATKGTAATKALCLYSRSSTLAPLLSLLYSTLATLDRRCNSALDCIIDCNTPARAVVSCA